MEKTPEYVWKAPYEPGARGRIKWIQICLNEEEERRRARRRCDVRRKAIVDDTTIRRDRVVVIVAEEYDGSQSGEDGESDRGGDVAGEDSGCEEGADAPAAKRRDNRHR